MINPKLIQTGKAVIDALRPVLFAMIGGFVVLKCQEQKPVQITVSNSSYEKQINDIQKTQRDIFNSLPTVDSAFGELSKRYPDRKTSATDR